MNTSLEGTPIYERALGTAFGRLQPELQDYFSLAPGSGSYGIGQGVFEVVGCRRRWLRPLLALASAEESLFPEYGEMVPFRIENHAHLDPFGRSSLTARREIFFPGRTRLFQDTTSAVGEDGGTRLVDYLGKHRRLATDLRLEVTPEGRLRGISAAARAFLGPLRLAVPAALDAQAYAEQWWDAGAGKHRIQVKVLQKHVGLVLVYAGYFDYRLAPLLPHAAAVNGGAGSGAAVGLPRYAEPDRWESRV
ncbi:DUF4166 domain-containing protein [Arthrobacter cupressi]|uniref:Uncharacterized protein n=1 Tax=Arthrobacter cupressi TaxID=1045773 RepID=A0A1G8P447_9MICC|nr:DUF4166 domain-containing protein [Arthrobacter cupressi]NYD76715.1 hypothetical protein [Arthrobacter cupressi]SDI87105.1 protein of unknown function [Arthrobacter cupressi]